MYITLVYCLDQSFNYKLTKSKTYIDEIVIKALD
jgi:hypothetical protein